LFTADEVLSRIDGNTDSGNVFKQNERDIINIFLQGKDIRNKKQLEYLSGTKHNPQEKIRFTLKPIFGFLFCIVGEKFNHFCWELLNSHATYLWSFERSISTDNQFKRVENTINTIRVIGRDEYRKAYNCKDAINARLLNRPENFHYISKFIHNAKKSDLTEYYHTKVSSYKVEKNGLYWKWKLSIGSRFDHDGVINHEKPIPFVRFFNPENDKLISRTPLSNSSLLETNAIAEEIKVTMGVFTKLDHVQLLIETKLMESEYFNWLYNHNLTLYSSIAHLTSSITEEKDLITTFNISSQISNLLLNLPSKLYDLIPTNQYLLEFGAKNQLLKSQRDKGHTFLNLILNYRDKYKDHSDFKIENVLDASDLPDVVKVQELINLEFEGFKQKVIDGPFKNKIVLKIENATKYFALKVLDSSKHPVIDFMDFDKPTLIFGDTFIEDKDYDYELFKRLVFNNFPITNTEWFLMQQDIYKELDSFYNICGI
jgi:hypothetical protein